MTHPLEPARAAAANVNRPTFAPISQTISFGRIRSIAFLSNIGSTFVIGLNRYLSPAEGVTKMGTPPKELGRRRGYTQSRVDSSTIFRAKDERRLVIQQPAMLPKPQAY